MCVCVCTLSLSLSHSHTHTHTKAAYALRGAGQQARQHEAAVLQRARCGYMRLVMRRVAQQQAGARFACFVCHRCVLCVF